jgi:type II secretory pathway component PulC
MCAQRWVPARSIALTLGVVVHVVWLCVALDREIPSDVRTTTSSSPMIITVPVLVMPAKAEPPWCPRGGLYFASRSALVAASRGGDKGPSLREILFGRRGLRAGDLLRTVDGHELGSYDELQQLLRTKVPSQTSLDVEIERNGVTCRRRIWLD